MYSISFPDMFSKSGSKINLMKDKEAVALNLRLLLNTTCGELFGDPDFGNLLKMRIYEQSSTILADLIIDDIYVAILTYMPQLKIERNNIKVYIKGIDVYADIKCTNLIDYQTDMYTIQLTNEDTL